VTVALALALFGTLEHYQFEKAYQAQNRDRFMVEVQSTRLAGIAELVPADAALGYLTDLEPESTPAKSAFNAVSYALAPRLLTRDSGQRWVLGNFSRPADYSALGKGHGLRVSRDFRNGVVLIERSGGR
jgi:hypothetical protein